MPDEDIIRMLKLRNESAIAVAAERYGAYIRRIANNILKVRRDAEECESDVYRTVWSRIPPEEPRSFKAFIGRVARNRALDMFRIRSAARRGGTDIVSELDECIPSPLSVEDAAEAGELAGYINDFLSGLPKNKRVVFVRRYWYSDGIREISDMTGFGESKVRSMLYRTRLELKNYLERRGVAV